MTFWKRLRERKLVQWALAYLAGAWVLLQLTSVLGGMYDLPGALVRAVPVLLAIGFVAAPVVAWYHGEQGRQRVSGPELLMLGALLLVAGAAVAWVGRGADGPAAVAAERPDPAERPAAGDAGQGSIAVLPFADFSPGRDQEWFSDGLTEELLNALAQVPGLRVAARTSSFAFKGQNVPIDEVARRLNVQHVLEGSVRRSGEQLRITAQLVAASDGYHLWSQTYDRRIEDIFDIQEEISRAIAVELRGRLGPEVMLAAVSTRMTDAETYDLYLRGRNHWRKGALADLEQAIELFHRATARDSSFALAWAGLADTYTRLAYWGHRPPREMLPPARAAAERAVGLDSLLAPARAVFAQTLRWWDHDRVGARREFLRALELSPYDALIHEWYAWFLADEGRTDQAIEHHRRAAELDPLSFTAVSQLGHIYVFAGRWEEAIAQFERGARLPGNPLGLGWRGRAHAMYRVGRGEEAIAALEALPERNVWQNAALGYLYAATGRTGDARRILAELHRQAQHRYVPAMTHAIVHMALGEHEAALDELERASQQGSLPPELNVIPDFEALRAHARFRTLVRRLGTETGTGEVP